MLPGPGHACFRRIMTLSSTGPGSQQQIHRFTAFFKSIFPSEPSEHDHGILDIFKKIWLKECPVERVGLVLP